MNISLISRAHAQCSAGVAEQTTDFGQACTVVDYVNLILVRAYPIIGAVAVLMIVYAGFLYMTSQGNPERTNTAKDIIIGVITGIALLFLIGIIMRTVGTPTP